MSAIFLDTVGLLALWDSADQWHIVAESAYSEIVSQRFPFITTTLILVECGNAGARRPYRSQVADLRRTLELRHELVVPTEQDWDEAWGAYEKGEAGNAGIVDLISFSVMRRLGITQAFTNDRHFQVAGFQVLF
jgi:predicted nucleic acid-binding protein